MGFSCPTKVTYMKNKKVYVVDSSWGTKIVWMSNTKQDLRCTKLPTLQTKSQIPVKEFQIAPTLPKINQENIPL